MADSLDQQYIDAIKQFEGYSPKAQWDYGQYSVGYGTKATHSGEVIDRETAEQRLNDEVAKAAGYVDKAFPELPEGARAALTSLTYNAGPGWINSGLGTAVRNSDWAGARNALLQYNKAGGQVLPGLVARRAQEAAWLTGAQQPQGAGILQAGGEAAPFGGAYPPGTATMAPPAPLSVQSIAARTTPAGVPLTAQAGPVGPLQAAPEQDPLAGLMPEPMQAMRFAALQRPQIRPVMQFNPMSQFLRGRA